MKTVFAVHTAFALIEPTKHLFAELLPDVRLINMADESLIQDVIQAGSVPPAVAKRLVSYYWAGIDAGADLIFNTCSSVGEIADLARPLLPVPIVKIDDAMTVEAVNSAESIGVLATVPTTLAPTIRLVQTKAAQMNKTVAVVDGLAEGAFQALMSGDAATHDRLILETGQRVAAEADMLILAQGSMARMENELAQATGKPVLSSPRRGVLAVKAALEEMSL